MLKGIDPLLTPELLKILAEMGHGDEIAIVDANFPAAAIAHRLERINAPGPRVLAAVLTLMPLDDFVEAPLASMRVVDAPDEIPKVVREYQSVANAAERKTVKLAQLDRFEFYERAKAAFAVVATAETRLYGNALVKKGVIRS